MGKFTRKRARAANDPGDETVVHGLTWMSLTHPHVHAIGIGTGQITAEFDDQDNVISVREDTVPVIGWKYVRWDLWDDRLTFNSGVGDSYDGLAARAEHRGNFAGRDETHAAPHVGCMCGWNAYRTRELARTRGGYSGTLVEVELWGNVHVYQHGYRAEWQRVLAMHIDRCECGEEPWRISQSGFPTCLSHVGDPTFATGLGLLEMALKRKGMTLVVNNDRPHRALPGS
jgi:hypothetical protein